jgi:hypothetical protein
MKTIPRRLRASLWATCLLFTPLASRAESLPADPPSPAAEAPAALPSEDLAKPKPPPAPYSLPFQLRPAAASTVIRSDTAFAFRQVAGQGGSTIASMLLGSYKVAPSLAVLVRAGVVHDSPPAGDAGSAFVNPVIGGTYVINLAPSLRLALFLGLALPLGAGGGNTPDKAVRSAVLAGIPARSAMDNAMFAVNYVTPFPGVDLAYVQGGLTVQIEATLLQLFRVRGEDVDKDKTRTNFTTGLHVGYFIVPQVSVAGEIRYQGWLSNASIPDGDARRDTVTFAVGPRFHFKIGDKSWFRPGVAYARALDNPMTDQKYNIVQLDLPISF